MIDEEIKFCNMAIHTLSKPYQYLKRNRADDNLK